MFERYTEKARRLIFFARYEASQFGSPYIESEHLLLGFLRENKAYLARVSRDESLTLDWFRQRVESHMPARKKIATSVDLPLTEECRRILLHASEEADSLDHKCIGTDHILLGILRENDCGAARLLDQNGISFEAVLAKIKNDLVTREAQLTDELERGNSHGIPAGYRLKNLLYNPASETIIVEMARAERAYPPVCRLFMRQKDTEDYEQIGDPADDISYKSPATCERQPIVIFNSMKSANGGGNPDGIYMFNLRTKELSLCVANDAVMIPVPHERSWVLSLVSLSDDAQTLYLKIGIEKPTSEGGRIEYYLASLRLADKKIELLSQLKNIRF